MGGRQLILVKQMFIVVAETIQPKGEKNLLLCVTLVQDNPH